MADVADVIYEGDVSFDGQGHATVSVEEFNRLAASEREALRMRAENERLQDGLRRVCNLIWPYRSESDARRSIAEAEAIRKNLADGRTWDGKVPEVGR